MRLLLVQFAGDYRAAQRLLDSTGAELYRGHRYILGQLARFREEFGEAAILCGLSDERYVEPLPSGAVAMGADAHPDRQAKTLIAMMEDYDPTHVVVLAPMPAITRWAIRSGRRTMCLFADSFNTGAVRRFLRFGRLATLLNDHRIDWVGNHGVNACRSLAKIGVDPDKIVPWDYPAERRPDDLPAKAGTTDGPATLFFAGEIIALKGVGDVIEAVAALKKRGLVVRFDIAGQGQVERFRALAERLGVADRVTFLGRIPNAQVTERMREATAVVVPSRHRYPEGSPLTIYEALCARTPIIASDHPMFEGRLIDGESALIFPETRAEALADQVARLIADPELQTRLSANAQAAWDRLQVPVEWGDLIGRWARDRPDDREWLAAHRLSAATGS